MSFHDVMHCSHPISEQADTFNIRLPLFFFRFAQRAKRARMTGFPGNTIFKQKMNIYDYKL